MRKIFSGTCWVFSAMAAFNFCVDLWAHYAATGEIGGSGSIHGLYALVYGLLAVHFDRGSA